MCLPTLIWDVINVINRNTSPGHLYIMTLPAFLVHFRSRKSLSLTHWCHNLPRWPWKWNMFLCENRGMQFKDTSSKMYYINSNEEYYLLLKFRLPEKPTKIWPTAPSTYNLTLQSKQCQRKRREGKIFVAFSEYLTFKSLKTTYFCSSTKWTISFWDDNHNSRFNGSFNCRQSHIFALFPFFLLTKINTTISN